jgi:hypothetical protein
MADNGFFLLPLIPTILVGVLRAESVLAPMFELSFVNQNEAKLYLLVAATDAIREEHLDIFEKEKNQEQKIECTPMQLDARLPGTDPGVRKRVREFHSQHGLDGFKFLKLSKLRRELPERLTFP